MKNKLSSSTDEMWFCASKILFKNKYVLKVGSKFRHPGDDAWYEVLEIDSAKDTIKVNFHTHLESRLSLQGTELDLLVGRFEMIE